MERDVIIEELIRRVTSLEAAVGDPLTHEYFSLHVRPGAPVHNAAEGVGYWDVTNDDFYINADGLNTWQLIAGGGGAVAPHSWLSASHPDTTPAVPQRGDVVTGQGAAPTTWTRLAHPGAPKAAEFLRANAADPGWAAIQNADVPSAIDVDPGTLSVATANVAATPHTHAITTSSSPGAAASILASSAAGLVQLVGLGIGAAPAAGGITMADGATIGQAAGPLLTFDDTGDVLRISGTGVLIDPGGALAAPDGTLHVHTASAGAVAAIVTDLVVETDPFGGISILTPAYGLGMLVFGSPTSPMMGGIAYDHADDKLMFIVEDDVDFTMTAHSFNVGGLAGIKMTSGTWIGIGDVLERIVFYVTGEIAVMDALFGIGTISPDRLFHAEASDAATAAITWAQRLTHITSGIAAAGFGVGTEYELETNGGQDVMGRLFVKLADPTHATRRGTFGIDLNRRGAWHEAVRIVAADMAPVAGNARGAGAVDFGQGRGAAAEVASGSFSVISGGYRPTASGFYSIVVGGAYNIASALGATVGGGYGNEATQNEATVSGGYLNQATAVYTAIPGGYYGLADKYGQVSSAAGRFAAIGDAQGTIQFVVRRNVVHSDANWYELFLDGAAQRMVIATDTVWTFDALITGTTAGCTKSFGFRIKGTIENDGGTTTLLASTVTTIYDTDDVSFDARASADDANDALLIEVQDSDGGGDVVRWVATIRTAEVTYPA